jgi:ribosome-associated toxin RatA of RatAB toxin-antitoxin module
MVYVERSIVILGPIQAVYELAKDMERYPEFMPDVESVRVIERESHRTVTEWETSVDGTPILWTEEDRFHDDKFLIEYQLIEGDLDKFEGEWRFVESKGGTEVTLTVDYDFGIPELTNLIGPTLQQKVGENSEMMLQGMKRRIEGL